MVDSVTYLKRFLAAQKIQISKERFFYCHTFKFKLLKPLITKTKTKTNQYQKACKLKIFKTHQQPASSQETKPLQK